VAVLADMVRRNTGLSSVESEHVRRLVGSWGPLADLAFADLRLFAPAAKAPDGQLLCLAQVRPSTAPTRYVDDWVGKFVPLDEQPIARVSLETGQIEYEDQVGERPDAEVGTVRRMAIPVRFEGNVIAVIVRETFASTHRTLGNLEVAYLNVFERLAEMVADGVFPFRFDDESGEDVPRVGDGVMVLNSRTHVAYASPNAVSAFHRLGFHGSIIGRGITDLGFKPETSRSLLVLKVPVVAEVERGRSVTISAQITPLITNDEVDGALVLLRDVSDIRSRERLLVSKDATIREIHHRVKNNLQTVSSLLRIQARRVKVEEARVALKEAERRIAAIAAVHDLLARDGRDDVVFGDVMKPILDMARDTAGSRVRFHLVGTGPILPTAKASSLAVVVNELVLNAVEHGFPVDQGSTGTVTVEMMHSPTEMMVGVHDDGVGISPDFDIDSAPGLGLTIIKTLVQQDLQGELTIRPASVPQKGTVAQLTVQLDNNGD